jgi:hypothetical protein
MPSQPSACLAVTANGPRVSELQLDAICLFADRAAIKQEFHDVMEV